MALILIADDVTVSREMLARGLRDAGHRVILVSDGPEAVERFERDRPDVVVLDVFMPGTSGIDVCNRIKSSDAGYTPVLFISARTDRDTRLQALAVGDDFVGKPYDVDELNARIEAHLRPRRMIEELRRAAPTPPTPSIDAATGLRGKPFFLERVGQEWRRSTRMNEPLSLFMVAVDGEGALAQVGAALQRVLRQIDTVCRFDVDRLAALLPNTHVSGALVSAERLKRELALSSSNSGGASLGIACYPGRDVNSPEDLVRLATRALDRAREEGPGHICLYQHQGYLFQPQI